jgi:hypothetical protein
VRDGGGIWPLNSARGRSMAWSLRRRVEEVTATGRDDATVARLTWNSAHKALREPRLDHGHLEGPPVAAACASASSASSKNGRRYIFPDPEDPRGQTRRAGRRPRSGTSTGRRMIRGRAGLGRRRLASRRLPLTRPVRTAPSSRSENGMSPAIALLRRPEALPFAGASRVVPARRANSARTHHHRDRGAAEVACGAADQGRFACL